VSTIVFSHLVILIVDVLYGDHQRLQEEPVTMVEIDSGVFHHDFDPVLKKTKRTTMIVPMMMLRMVADSGLATRTFRSDIDTRFLSNRTHTHSLHDKHTDH
jgi:hypothetical protein